MPLFKDPETGHLFEERVLGVCLAKSRGHMQWREAAEAVRKGQPREKKPIAARLENEVGKQLGGRCMLYTAVRSSMDIFHGVDGFFEFQGTVVTVDLTLNPNKDSGKADVIIYPDDIDDLPALVARIVREFGTKQRRAAG